MMKLIQEWKRGWKLWSVQLNALGIAILTCADIFNSAWTAMAPSLAPHLPYAKYVAIVVFLASLVSRFIQQGKPDGEQ